jgi:NAD(P)H-hydrate epimerase
MKLLTARQIKEWDAYTIMHEPVTSVGLMERAAEAFTKQFNTQYRRTGLPRSVKIFCGLGNNGGDGLAIARLLAHEQWHVEVFIVGHSKKRSNGFVANEKKLSDRKTVLMTYMDEKSVLPVIGANDLVIDALFGTGLNKPLDGLATKVVRHINRYSRQTVAVDIPSGLPAELFSFYDLDADTIVHAHRTFTFQVPKQSFLYAETFPFVGYFEVLDIGLKKDFLEHTEATYVYVTADELPERKPRSKYAHKGTFGHALCIGGSYGKIGAAVLTGKACLRTGCGLVTAFVPKVGYTILQTALPECMVMTDDEIMEIRNFPPVDRFDAMSVGPGLGTNEYTLKGLYKWLPAVTIPCVIDADALNNISKLLVEHHDSFRFPENAVITPHPGEFDRLAGSSKNSLERLQKQVHFARKHHIYVVLKGAHTTITTPGGKVYFNATGNPAMATAGSGDALTGIITSLLAQGYAPEDAAVLGVYVHGLAGDIAAEAKATLIASDIIESIPLAILQALPAEVQR